MKISPRQRLVAELSAIRKLQDNPPGFFKASDYTRLAAEFAHKSRQLVEIEIRAYQKRLA